MAEDAGWAEADALGSRVIKTVREQVPEFDQTFGQLLRDEGGRFGAFQAMSEFARWLVVRLHASPDALEVQRAFDVIERIAKAGYPIGRPLVAELVEALSNDPVAAARLGPATRELLGPV